MGELHLATRRASLVKVGEKRLVLALKKEKTNQKKTRTSLTSRIGEVRVERRAKRSSLKERKEEYVYTLYNVID